MIFGRRFESLSHVCSLALEAVDEVGHVEDQAERLRQLVQQVGQELHIVRRNLKKQLLKLYKINFQNVGETAWAAKLLS